jgi:hypothetical protein
VYYRKIDRLLKIERAELRPPAMMPARFTPAPRPALAAIVSAPLHVQEACRSEATMNNNSRHWLRVWIIFSAIWLGGIAYAASRSWPALSLDLPRRDPQVQAAYDRAVATHVARHALLALAPPGFVLLAGWLTGRRPRS